jgi:hypothetical protein
MTLSVSVPEFNGEHFLFPQIKENVYKILLADATL